MFTKTTTHKKVLLTGASGFIAIHTLQTLLSRGYKVKATVRSIPKGDYLVSKFPNLPLEIAIVPDISEPNAFDTVLKEDSEITAVIHMASPFFHPQSDPETQILKPAIQGTRNIVQAVHRFAPQVTKVVITSSFASILDVDKMNDHSTVFSEESWSPITWQESVEDLSKTYRGSKKLAEKEFWKFINENDDVNFSGTTVNPPFVFGPLIQQVSDIKSINTSNAVIYNTLFGENSKEDKDYTELTHLWVDVRDVALAHVLPLEDEESKFNGQRLFTTAGYFSPQLILDIANEKFPELKGKIPVGKPGTGLDRVDKIYQYDNKKTNELLNFEYRKFEDTIVETIQSILEFKEILN